MRRLGAFLSLFVCLSAILFGQGTTSRVVGTVTDPTGSAVSNAKVTLTNEATGVSYETTTSDAGTYLFEAIQIGSYTVDVSSAGFRRFVARNNQLTIGQPMTVNVKLELGQLAESVEVTAAAELVQTSTSANIGPTINERTMTEMPIVATRRRDPTSILAVVPGMDNGTSGAGGGGHMNGARDRAWNFTLDGIDMNEVSAGGGIGNNPIRVNPDSVAEMKIITSNASAEYGRNSGAQVALVTRSGTNELHGNAFWFYRTPSLNANTWANNFNNIGKEMFVQNIYGGSVGGPIIKNKTFYFGNWQELRAVRNITQTATVLTKEARQGLFRYVTTGRNTPAGVANASVDANGNPIVPTATYNIVANDPLKLGLDPTIKALVDQTPLPNRFDLGDGLNTAGLVFRPTETEAQRDLTFKVDHILNEKNAFYGRIYWGFQNTLCDSVNGGLPKVPGGPCNENTLRKPRNYAFNWRTNPRAAITNEFVAGWSEFWFDFPNPFQDLNTPSISTSAYTIPVSYFYNNTRKLQTLQFMDNLSWFKGKHNLKMGTNIRLIKHIDDRGSIGGLNSGLEVTMGTTNPVDPVLYNIPQSQMNTNDFAALRTMTHFELGIVDQIRQGFVASGDQFTKGTFQFQSKYNEYDFYFQDTWKVRKNLTIDLGLRLDARMAPRSAVSEPILAPNYIPVAGAAPKTNLTWGPGQLWNDDWNNFGPSLGIAWDPFGKGKTSIRSNYRLAYDRVPTFLISGALLPNMPGSTLGITNVTFGANNGRLRNLPALTIPAKPGELRQPIPFSVNTNTVVDPSLETPTTNMWSFGIQHEILNRTVLEVNYLGRRAYNLLGAYNTNQAEIRKNGFLDAFKVVQAGGQSPLFDAIFAADSRRGATETGADFARRLYGDTIRLGNVGSLATTLAQRPQSGTNLTGASGLGSTFFMPYPQFSGGLTVVDSNDFSTYHSLQVSLNRQFAHGAQVGVSYVWSKSLDTRSYDPALTVYTSGANQSSSSTPLDINNRRLNYGLSNFDRTHSLLANFVYELPFGRGQRWSSSNGVFDRIIGGWQMSGLLRATSGYPFSAYSGVLGFNSVVQSFVNCNGCSRDMGNTHMENGYVWYFTQEERAKMSAPAAGEIGNTGRNFFRGPGYFNLDFSLAKKTRITERFNLELRADVSNLTNTPSFEIPTTTYTSTLYGRIGATLVSGPRQIMLGTKLNF